MDHRHDQGTERDADALGLDMTGAEDRHPNDDARPAPDDDVRISPPQVAGPTHTGSASPTIHTPADPDQPTTTGSPNPAPPLSDDLAGEIAAGSDPNSPIRQRIAAWRAKVAAHPQWRGVYRAVIAAVGGAIVVIGMVLLAIPGPGWLCIFLGLGVLSTEFIWARRISDRLKRILAWATGHWHTFRARRKERKRARLQAKAEAKPDQV